MQRLDLSSHDVHVSARTGTTQRDDRTREGSNGRGTTRKKKRRRTEQNPPKRTTAPSQSSLVSFSLPLGFSSFLASRVEVVLRSSVPVLRWETETSQLYLSGWIVATPPAQFPRASFACPPAPPPLVAEKGCSEESDRDNVGRVGTGRVVELVGAIVDVGLIVRSCHSALLYYASDGPSGDVSRLDQERRKGRKMKM